MFIVVLILQFFCWSIISCNEILFDNNGQCSLETPFVVSRHQHFHIRSVNLVNNKQPFDCLIHFRALPEYGGVCFVFQDYFINDCNVTLSIYEDLKEEEHLWRKFDCHSMKPIQLCSPHRDVFLEILKENHSSDIGYGFNITVKEYSSVSARRVAFTPYYLLLIIIIVILIVILLTLLACLVCCCCYREEKKPAETTYIMPKDTKPYYESQTLPYSYNSRKWY